MSFVPRKSATQDLVQVGEWCVQYLLPSLEAASQVNLQSFTVTATWQSGATLEGPICDVLRAADRASFERVRERENRFRERWKMDRFLNR